MRKLKIYRLYFTNSDCYKSGVIQTPKGIQVHSTGANNLYLKRYVGPDDGLLGKNQYNNTHNRPGGDVCANAYIGKLNDGTPAIYQTLPWDMRCWLSANGKNGNANKMGYIGFEICEDNRKNKEYFDEVVMGLSVNLVAYLCVTYNIPLENVLDHSELYKKGIGSNHGDITWWLQNFGLNMDSYRIAVRQAMTEGVEVEYVEQKEVSAVYNAKVVAASGNTVNFRSAPTEGAVILAKIPVGTTVEVLQETNSSWNQIRYNGKTGYMMSKFLQKISAEAAKDDSTDLKKIKSYLEAALELVNKMIK